VTGVEIRMGTVESKNGSSTSVRGIGVEVALVRDKKVSSSDTTVLDYQGKSAGLTAAETAKGLAKGSYTHEGEATASGTTDAGSAALLKARNALSKVQQTSDALRSFRNGDSGPLDALRSQLQNGTSAKTQAQSSTTDPTAALTSKDPKVRHAMLAQMASSYKLFV